jgi:hypothetical protein
MAPFPLACTPNLSQFHIWLVGTCVNYTFLLDLCRTTLDLLSINLSHTKPLDRRQPSMRNQFA